MAAIGELADDTDHPLSLKVFEDDNGAPAEGNARVRVVHASPDAPAVDVRVASTGDAVFEGVSFGEAGYAEVPAGEYRLCVYPAGNSEDAINGIDIDLAAGTVYSAFATGYVTPDDKPADVPFQIVVAEDAMPAGDVDH